MELLHILAYFIIAVFSSLFLFLYKRNQYWQDRNVLQDRPVLFFGNMRGVGKTQAFRDPFYNFYMKYKVQAPFGGFYLSLRPCLVVFDLDLIKRILIKDFHNFADRGNYHNERDDPLTANLLNLDGPKWRRLRAKLTPTFTSGKMKFMFGTVVEVAERFVSVLADYVEEKTVAIKKSEAVEIEIKDLLARFTTDVIASCAFGVECNSLADPQAAFRVMGHRAFMERRQGHIAFAFTNAFPNLARKLHMKVLRDDVSAFFMRVVREMVEYRDRENVQRNDFMNLLMQLRNNNETEGLSIEEMAAQAFVFFMAGFESSSSTVTFALYELALNQDIQNKAREEITAMFERYENKFTYEGMNELKYTHQIFQETLRKYSIAPAIARKAINDYPIPNSKHVIEKGTLIIVPIDALQRDPAIYPEPEVFNPDRFLPTEVEKRHSMAWLPFGEGPRNCIASRFGEMQSIIGLALLLKNFRFTASEKTPIPIVFDKKTISLTPEGGNLHLNVEKI